jgi:hypothetical protein
MELKAKITEKEFEIISIFHSLTTKYGDKYIIENFTNGFIDLVNILSGENAYIYKTIANDFYVYDKNKTTNLYECILSL